jgi:hypothetical protein
MAIKREIIDGTKIINEIESSNIKKTTFDTETKSLITEFNNGLVYEYEDVPHEVFASLNLAESAGKFFNTNIKKNYSYRKVTPITA